MATNKVQQLQQHQQYQHQFLFQSSSPSSNSLSIFSHNGGRGGAIGGGGASKKNLITYQKIANLERKITENPDQKPSFKLLLDYGNCLSNLGEIHNALAVFAHCFRFQHTAVSGDDLGVFVGVLVKSIHNHRRARGKSTFEPYSCGICLGVLCDPRTLPCGHSFCKLCLNNLNHCDNKSCKKCGAQYKETINTNIFANLICQKIWTKELEAARIRNEGCQMFLEGKTDEAIKKLSRACELCPTDHVAFAFRSEVFVQSNSVSEALSDAETAIRIRPDWAEGYFRKAVALESDNRCEEALKSIFDSLSLDKFNRKFREELTNILTVLLRRSSNLLTPLILDESFRAARRTRKPKRRVRTPVSINKVDSSDFECALCFRFLWEPVTTPCGHCYCRMCLDRSLDHQSACPICKADLSLYLAERRNSVTEFIETSMKQFAPDSYEERQIQHEQEMTELSTETEIPIFVCTMSYPSIPCPLHVFEPRYRLMIRRCIETGTRQFGMCCALKGGDDKQYAEFGTMLEIRDIEYFPDGRSVLDTVGGRRFKILSRGVKDGYNVATVEFIQDESVEQSEVADLHDETLRMSTEWFSKMKLSIREGILNHYGKIPEPEEEYWRSVSGPSWTWWILAILPVDQQAQVQILSQVSLKRRLEAIKRILILITARSKTN